MNRAGITTHLTSPGRMGEHYTACGQHRTHSNAGEPFGSKLRAVPLAVAKEGIQPTCQRCQKHFRSPRPATEALLKSSRAARSRELARHPGAKWRFQTEGTLAIEDRGETDAAGRFDEVVVDDWLHAEMMNRRSCFVSVAGLSIWIRIGKNGAEIYDIELPDGDARRRVTELLQQISGRQ